MALFTDVVTLIPTLGERVDGDVRVEDVLSMIAGMSDAEVVSVLQESVEVERLCEQIKLLSVGIVALRSGRERGHAGLAQSSGDRSAVDLVQRVTGSTRGEAAREVRVGLAMVDQERDADADDAGFDWGSGPGSDGDGRFGDDCGSGGEGAGGAGDPGDAGDSAGGASGSGEPSGLGESSGSGEPAPAPKQWHEPLRAALREGWITAAQFDAIRSGLGEPPVGDADSPADRAAVQEAWSCAAEQLVTEAAERTVEELRSAARLLRDRLDPEGATARFRAQYEARSFRVYRDAEGRKRGSIVFDEENGAFVDAFMDAALRPRRGGPRFVDSDEKRAAAALADDPRTNDQLAFDLLMDVVHAGVLADAASVFGTRQAGVRLVQPVSADGTRSPIAHTEDRLVAMPAFVADQHACESGYIPVTVDSCGNPLDVGREQRLFTPRQRIALAIRDGGCRWRGCDRPASYCEAHHIDEWAGGGRTDIDRGILLCRYHHMALHQHGWRIIRDGRGDFILLRQGDEPVILKPRAALAHTWADAWPEAGVDPPPKRFHPAA